ncbi:MAG: Maf family protein [Anaerolineales bacterium]
MPLKLVLASNSPRRKTLLGLGRWPFEVAPADINEDPLPAEEPQAYVLRLAEEKARVAAAAYHGQDALVLAADTTVAHAGRILGKPADAQEARAILKELRGKEHIALTAIALIRTLDGARLSDLAVTQVPMRSYSDEEIEAYIASGDPLDKAGAYAIQHAGFHPVAAMQGCFANVAGLPLCHLMRTLAKWDIFFDADLPRACQAHLNYACPVTDDILAWRQ